MAGTAVTHSHALAQTYQRGGLILQAELRAMMLALCGTDPDSVFVVEPSAGQKRGTLEKVRFQAWNTSPMPKGRGEQSYGKEGGDQWFEDEFRIGYLRLADRGVECEISDQNEVEFSLRDSVETGLAHDSGLIMEYQFIHQLAGFTPVNNLTSGAPDGLGYRRGTTDYVMSGCNACVEPDTAHHFFCPGNGGANANEAAVAADPTAFLTDRFVDECLMNLSTDEYGVLWPIPLASTPWGMGRIVLCNGEGMRQVKANSSDSDIYDLARACIEGGMDPENSTLWTNEGFKIRDTFYLQSNFLTLGTSGSSPGTTNTGTARANCARALVLGPRAAHVRWGEGFSRNKWIGGKETVFERRFSMFSDTVFGCKTTIVNGQRWGSAVISHYTKKTTSRYS